MVPVASSVWHEPRPRGVPPTGPADRLLAALYALAVLLEGLLRPDVVWRPLVTVLALALAPAVLLRRAHPLAAALAGWGAVGALAVTDLFVRPAELGLTSMSTVLVLLFALVRWGSGREAVLGLGVVTGVVALGVVATATGASEIFGGSLLVLFVAALGLIARSRADLWERRHREIRNQERVALARELHDTVAHHVSAIAVQAQAGGVVAATEPARAAEVLAAIEAEASRTLTEMRAVVRVLRDAETGAPGPVPGLSDLPVLARADTTPAVEVVLDTAPVRVSPAVGAAVYRMTQESLTNARRHARGATRVVVDVRLDGTAVRLRVSDDGRPGGGGTAAEPGFGLRGMAERARLLGGTLAAGPAPGGGWLVEAVLPAEAGS